MTHKISDTTGVTGATGAIMAATTAGQQQIPSEEVTAHSLSFSDYNGRLFCWQPAEGGAKPSHLYRAIPADQAPLYRELFDRGVVRSLIEQNLLIDTQLTDLALGEYDLILQHRRIPFVTYPAEWCADMLKAAALVHLDLCIALDRDDLTTDDAHPINILFAGCQPYFVDFGSINRLPKASWYPWPWPPYEQFCQVFLYPLLLRAHGQGRLARWCAHDFENGVLRSELNRLIRRPISRLRLAESGAQFMSAYGQPLIHLPFLLRPFVRKGSVFLGKWLTRISGIASSRGRFLQQVRAEVASIRLPVYPADLPAGNSPTCAPSICAPSTCAPSICAPSICAPSIYKSAVHQILTDLQPGSVLDVNSGDSGGAYAMLAAEVLAKGDCAANSANSAPSLPVTNRVVAIDPDEQKVSALYRQAIARNASILPLVMNFASPSDGLSNQFLAPAHQRLQCELVMALTIDPELMLKRGFGFVIDRLAAFSSRWLLTAFTPRPHATLTTRWQDRTIRCDWYSLAGFKAALSERFGRVEVVVSSAGPKKVADAEPGARGQTTVLLLCQR